MAKSALELKLSRGLATAADWARSALIHARRLYRVHYRPVVELHGVRLQIGPSISPGVQKSILCGTYEQGEREILERVVRPDDVVLELGTGLGFLSIYCAKLIGSGRVFSYEANPELEPVVRRNYELNGVCPAFEIGILGAGAGERTFFIEPDMWSSSTIRRSPRARAVQVPIRSLAEAMARVRPTLLIIDIEGGEHELIAYLGLAGVRRVLIELHPRVIGEPKVAEVVSFFRAAGFAASNHSKQSVVVFER